MVSFDFEFHFSVQLNHKNTNLAIGPWLKIRFIIAIRKMKAHFYLFKGEVSIRYWVEEFKIARRNKIFSENISWFLTEELCVDLVGIFIFVCFQIFEIECWVYKIEHFWYHLRFCIWSSFWDSRSYSWDLCWPNEVTITIFRVKRLEHWLGRWIVIKNYVFQSMSKV